MDEPSSLQKPDRRRPEPLWHQAEMALRALIEAGEWGAGSQIPNEDRLGEMLGISRITLRHALRNLEEAGLLRREHGRGTFVRSATVVAGVRGLTNFTEEMRTLALAASTQLVEAHRIGATLEMADALEIAIGDSVVQLKRLRLGNGLPIGIQTSHLPEARVPGLFADAANVQSLYRWLDEHCGIKPVKAKEIYRVGRVAEADAELIQLPTNTPAFEVERIGYDSRGPFEYTLSTMRADRYEIRSTLYV
jgi:GntR family transcriptional regulator